MKSQMKKPHRAKPGEKGSELLNLVTAWVHLDRNSLHALFRCTTLQEYPYVQLSVRQYHHVGMTHDIIGDHLSFQPRSSPEVGAVSAIPLQLHWKSASMGGYFWTFQISSH